MLNHRLNETKIGTATVIVDILPKGKCIPNTKITPTTVTVHNTGNVNASAKNNHQYMKNINKSGERTASWHVTVGWDFIIQAQSFNYKCYHAGCSNGNNTSIGIEIAMYSDAEKQKQAYLNAIELVKILLKYYGWGIDKVKRHKDFSGKHCPAWLIEGKYGYTWDWFKNQIQAQPIASPTTGFKPYLAKCNVATLNCRKGAGTNYAVERKITKDTVITIIEEKVVNGVKWGRSKSNYWVALQYMTFVKYA